MSEWYEFRFWYAGQPSASSLYQYKREILLPALRAHRLEHFLMLDEPEFMLLRTPPEGWLPNSLTASLESTLAPNFSKITVETWSATEDARNRIQSAKHRLPDNLLPDNESGWEVRGRNDQGQWLVSPADLDSEIEAFAKFMTRVTGKFTETYISEMPSRIENRWLMSLFIHLMLDSISVSQPEEQEIREFPYI